MARTASRTLAHLALVLLVALSLGSCWSEDTDMAPGPLRDTPSPTSVSAIAIGQELAELPTPTT